MNAILRFIGSVVVVMLLTCGHTLAGQGSPFPAVPPPPNPDPLVLADDSTETDLTGEANPGELTLGEIFDLLLSMYSVRLL